MDRVADLTQLDNHAGLKFSRFSRRAELLRRNKDDGSRDLDGHQIEAETSSLIINLQSYWANWCRAFYLSGAHGSVFVSGTVFNSQFPIQNVQQAITVAIHGTLSPNKTPPPVWPSKMEPHWHSPNALSQVINKAQLSNLTTLSTILASAPPSFPHLRIFRNYYGHRSEALKRDALNLGPTYLVGLARKPSDILLFVEPGRTVSVVERWIISMRQFAGALCA